jgi:hypothetical protein
MDERAAKAYDRVYEKTGNRSLAMREFWSICNNLIPRPMQQIKALQSNLNGLVLSDNRRVDWHIAALKAKNGELLIPPSMKKLLTEKLARVKDASEFVNAL